MAEVGFETTEPDSPARFELLAEAPGTYPIELLEADRQIGELEISGATRRRSCGRPGRRGPAMRRPLPSHHGHVTGFGSPPRPEITRPVPRQGVQRSGSCGSLMHGPR